MGAYFYGSTWKYLKRGVSLLIYLLGEEVSMVNKKVTLSLDKDVYANFQKFCEINDVMLSKRVERLIKEHLKKGGKKEVVK